jgi:hypothetical protein
LWLNYFDFRFAFKLKCFIMFICHSKCSCYKGFRHRLRAFLNFLWDPRSFQHSWIILSGIHTLLIFLDFLFF